MHMQVDGRTRALIDGTELLPYTQLPRGVFQRMQSFNLTEWRALLDSTARVDGPNAIQFYRVRLRDNPREYEKQQQSSRNLDRVYID